VVVTALLAVATGIVWADVRPAGQAMPPDESTSNAQPEKLAPGTGYPGVYVARDWRVIDPSVYPVVGGHDSFTWSELEPSEGVYNWARLDNFIAAQAALGKKAAFGITTYNGRIEGGLQVPGWFSSSYPGALITCSDSWQIPRYWHNDYLTKYGNFVTALANHIGSDSRLAYIQVGIGLYGEIQPSDDSDDLCVKNAMDADFGFTNDTQRSDKWTATVKSIIDKWGTAFSGKSQRLFVVYTPRFISICEKRDITTYAAETYGMGLFAGGVYADQTTVFSNPPGGEGCQKWDPIVKWNGITTRTIPVALETYRYMLPDYQTFYWGVLSVLNKHADYFSLESDLLYSGNPSNPVSENFDMIRFANDYLGKTAATAPNAWVALRETSPATNGFGCNRPNVYFPQFGDYDYWLYRDDTVTGGRTITVSNIATYTIQDAFCGTVGSVQANPQYDPLLAGKGPQGWMTRRTDHASGNDYMYFRADDSFIAGQGITSAVVITVTYFDHGSDNWSLQYKTVGGSEQTRTVTKTNTDQWKTASFIVMDMAFDGQYANGNDFRIYNGGSGDEYIHMVALGKYRPAGPTPTPTLTRTPTATATPTPITVVFQKGISPSPSYNGVSDTYISNYGDPDANYGISPTLSLRNSDYKASLLRFDVSSIPPTANVLSATLSVHAWNSTNANPLDVSVFRLLRSWSETAATWNQAAVGSPWAVPGANGIGSDRDDYAISTVTMSQYGVWYNFDVTDFARWWVQNPGQNFGLVLKAIDGSQVEYELWSSDYEFAPQVRPKLTIVYSTSFAGPTATATPTRTHTPAPTSTPTRTPTPLTIVFQNGVGPVASYNGVVDTFISNFADTTTNYGDAQAIELRTNDIRAALLRFDLSSLPAGANILSATMSVHVDYRTNDFSLPVNLYSMFRPWDEMQATWISATNSVAWAVPGANGGSDRSTTATASATMSNIYTWYDFDVTDLVRQWVTNASNNKGVILKAGSGPSVAYGLRSSEYFANPNYRPKLTIRCYGCQPQGTYRIMLPVILNNFTVMP